MSRTITAPFLPAAFVVVLAFVHSGDAFARPVMLINRNYCGPGNNAPLAPIDALDAACARHDACTPDDGLPTKACKMQIQAEAEPVGSDPGQPRDLRMMASIVASAAAMMPSTLSGSLAASGAPPYAYASHRPDAMRHPRAYAMGIQGE